MKPLSLAAQVSTHHSARDTLSVDRVMAAVAAAQSTLPLSILMVGSQEVEGLYRALIDQSARQGCETYLWYNLLSDYPGQSSAEEVINWRGEQGARWEGWQESGAEVAETFQFSCPNNPIARQKTLDGLAALLQKYPFQGVFLDKLRFPSPAGGMAMTLSCFCPHCYAAAATAGLDLDEVKACLQDWKAEASSQTGALLPPGSPWLEALCHNHPLIQKFIHFRAARITALVREVRSLTDQYQRKLALDLFSPAFAACVGQDYPSLAGMADLVKPMTYQAALGPAGLRLEAKALINGIEEIYRIPEDEILQWAERHCPDFTRDNYRQMIERRVPLEWMSAEVARAVQHSRPTPVWMGLETVTLPGVIQTSPEQVRSMLTTGIQCGIQGAVISWDLLHTPRENLLAIQACLAG